MPSAFLPDWIGLARDPRAPRPPWTLNDPICGLSRLVQPPVVRIDPVAVLERHVVGDLVLEDVPHALGQRPPALGVVASPHRSAARVVAGRRGAVDTGRRVGAAVVRLGTVGLRRVGLLAFRLLARGVRRLFPLRRPALAFLLQGALTVLLWLTRSHPRAHSCPAALAPQALGDLEDLLDARHRLLALLAV